MKDKMSNKDNYNIRSVLRKVSPNECTMSDKLCSAGIGIQLLPLKTRRDKNIIIFNPTLKSTNSVKMQSSLPNILPVKSVQRPAMLNTEMQCSDNKTTRKFCLPMSSRNSISSTSISRELVENINNKKERNLTTFVGYVRPQYTSTKDGSALQKFTVEEESILVSPSSRWQNQPSCYQGAIREKSRPIQQNVSKNVPSFIDTTDGETSGIGSSVDEPVESSTESASETTFQHPRLTYRPSTTSPFMMKKRRGGWPKGRKRKPELQMPKHPKAPLTAYVLFLNQRRKFYKDSQPNLPFIEVSKLMGSEWSSMSAVDKAVYMTRADQEKKRYRNELQIYRQSHEYQLALRKKRIKSKSENTTTEESSDFTDDVDDDDSEELYCRSCDQWFTSLHNKREHLNGRLHICVMTGEYWRERSAEERRRICPYDISDASSGAENSNSSLMRGETLSEDTGTFPSTSRVTFSDAFEDDNKSFADQNVAGLITSDDTSCSSLRVSNLRPVGRETFEPISTTEDDDDDDYEEDEEYDGEAEVTEEEIDSDRVTDAAVLLMRRVVGRETELRYLRRRNEKAHNHHTKLTASLANLNHKQQILKEQQEALGHEEKVIRKKLDSIFQVLVNTKLRGFSNEEEKANHIVGGGPVPALNWPERTTVIGSESLQSSDMNKSNLKPFSIDTKFIQIKTVKRMNKDDHTLDEKSPIGNLKLNVKRVNKVNQSCPPKSRGALVQKDTHLPRTFLKPTFCEEKGDDLKKALVKAFNPYFPEDPPVVETVSSRLCADNLAINTRCLAESEPLIRRPSSLGTECCDSEIKSPSVNHSACSRSCFEAEISSCCLRKLDVPSIISNPQIMKNSIPSLLSKVKEESRWPKIPPRGSSPLISPCGDELGEAFSLSPTISDALCLNDETVEIPFICEETFFRQFNVDFAYEASRLLNCTENE